MSGLGKCWYQPKCSLCCSAQLHQYGELVGAQETGERGQICPVSTLVASRAQWGSLGVKSWVKRSCLLSSQLHLPVPPSLCLTTAVERHWLPQDRIQTFKEASRPWAFLNFSYKGSDSSLYFINSLKETRESCSHVNSRELEPMLSASLEHFLLLIRRLCS